MKISKFAMWLFAGVACLLMGTYTQVDARGGGRGGGRGGRGGPGGGGRGGGRGGRGGGRGGNSRGGERKEEQERQRREERQARVAAARIEYAKRERESMWDKEAQDRLDATIRRVLGSATE